MPITLKQGMMAYKDGNEYHGINVVGETTTANQVASIQSAGAIAVASVQSAETSAVTAVQAAGTSAVTSIQTAGQTARESIPSEYTALTNDVSDLKSAITLSETSSIDPTTTDNYYQTSITNNKWSSGANKRSYFYPRPDFSDHIIITANNNNPSVFAMLTDDSHTHGQMPSYATGTGVNGIEAGQTAEFDIPADCQYLYFYGYNGTAIYTPSSVVITGVEYTDKTLSVTGKSADAKVTGDAIKGLVGKINIEYYVSSNGNDETGDGTSTSPFATFAKALSEGATTINMLSDMYESLSLTGKNLTVKGNGYTIYGDTVLETEAYNSILRASYNDATDSRIKGCYIDRTIDLTETVTGSSWKGPKYNIACFADDQKLLPVEDIATCEATSNSFTWDNGYFYINASGNRFSYAKSSYAAAILGGKCIFDNVQLKHCQSHILNASNADIEINGSKVIGSVNQNCIYLVDSNLVARNVEIALCWNDGVNAHSSGNSVLIDCYCHDCSDDGVSQHDNTTGVVMGGEFANCGKGGISSPINAAKVDIYNAYCHDNDYGIYAVASNSTSQTFNVFGCVVTGNRVGVIVGGHTARMYGNKITGNTQNNTTTESGGTIVDLDS